MNKKTILLHPVFVICCLLFIIHQVVQKVLNIQLAFADAYLDNFLCMPILLTLMLAERRWLFRYPAYRFQVIEIILVTVMVAVVTEWVFPYFSNRFTTDGYDILFLTAGSILFYFTINKAQHRV